MERARGIFIIKPLREANPPQCGHLILQCGHRYTVAVELHCGLCAEGEKGKKKEIRSSDLVTTQTDRKREREVDIVSFGFS